MLDDLQELLEKCRKMEVLMREDAHAAGGNSVMHGIADKWKRWGDAIEAISPGVSERWIPVSERRLPKRDTAVLFYNLAYTIGYLDQHGSWWGNGIRQSTFPPTHWMPLPAAPMKEEGRG